jgi:hypothetical protein
MSLAILTNMMSAFVYYLKHIRNHRVAWQNYLTNTYTYTLATMTLLTGCYKTLPRTRPVKDFLLDVIRCLRML